MLIVGGGAIGTLFACDAAKRLSSVPIRKSRLVLATRRPFAIPNQLSLLDRLTDAKAPKEIFAVETRQLRDIQNEYFDVVLIACKNHDLASCARDLRVNGIRARTCVPLANGLGVTDQVEKGGLECEELVPAITYSGAKLLERGSVERTGQGDVVMVRPKCDEDASTIFHAFPRVRFSASKEEFERELWTKLLANCVINPLTAISGLPNGDIPSRFPDLVRSLCEEFLKTCPVQLNLDAEALIKQVCQRTSANTSSMLADVRERRRTEIESLNGAVVKIARAKGVAVPTHELVYRIVRDMETLLVRSAARS